MSEWLSNLASQTRNGADMRQVALALVEAGAYFVPIRKQNKAAYIKDWPNIPLSNPQQIAEWLAKWPDLMWGLLAGRNGLLVIDLDKAKRPGDPDGIEEFKAICEPHNYDFLDVTLCAKSSSGGIHVYFKMPVDHKLGNTNQKMGRALGQAIDTRGKGGYITLPPSIGVNGPYEWLNENPVADIPDWLLQRLLPKEPSRQIEKIVFTGAGYANDRERKAYQSAFEGECRIVASAVDGARNRTLNDAALKLGHYVGAGKLNESEVCDGLLRAAQACGLEGREIRPTILSGLNKGKAEPREIQPHNGSWQSLSNARQDNASQNEASKDNASTPQDKENELVKYLANTNAKWLMEGFEDAAREFAQTSAILTGYPNLDDLLDGGLYPGFYVLGAIPSLGKSTFVLQMADAIAQTGQHVLIFSLEMSRYELIAKSLSRISKQQVTSAGWPEYAAKPARYFLSGGWCRDEATIEEGKYYYEAIEVYAEYAQNLYIIEGDFELTALGVKREVEKHINLTGKRPVVIVDYLQILKPMGSCYTDKQAVDQSVIALKRLSRDKKLPLIAISSFNRESYERAVSMAAFKESGGLEYGTDFLIGLQFAGIGREPKLNIDQAMKANPREIELVVLKNRHGEQGKTQFKYYPKYNFFMS